MLGFFRPHAYARRISEVDPIELRRQGIVGAIVDLDNTLVGFRSLAPLEEDALWVRRAREAELRVLVLTNNGTRWASQIAQDLGVPCVPRARKPLPRGFRRSTSSNSTHATRSSSAISSSPTSWARSSPACA